ncbi:MAG: DEAD/DEAH box helicase [Candidatus Hodarchaeota archaeon]
MFIESLALNDSIKKVFIQIDGIKELYPPQTDAINRGLLEGKNLVIAIPTAAGKTLLAELAALKHVIEMKGKVIYLCPLRALASEKFSAFKRFSQLGIRVAITSGDYDSNDSYLSRYDIIVSTNEKMDALLRHRATWIAEQVTLVIIDECHLLDDQHRGPTLETLLARLMMENTSSQLIALSATVGNADELAEWLNAELVQSEWRPVPLKEGVYFDDQVTYSDFSSREVPFRRKDQLINITLDSIHAQEQILIFTPSRRSAVATAERIGKIVESSIKPREAKHLDETSSQAVINLSDPLSKKLAETIKRGVTFHHAGLNSQQRELVETAFKKGFIKALCATPTLASGVNIPAKRVVVSSVYRYSIEEGSHPIKTLEYKQMCFPEKSLVLTPTSEIEIQSLGKGDRVIGYSNNGELVHDEVIEVFEREADTLINLKTSLGVELVGTPEHPVWTTSGWKNLGELNDNDAIAYINKINLPHTSIHMIDLIPVEDVYIPNAKWIFDEVTNHKGWGKHKISRFLGVDKPGSLHHYRKGRKATKLSWVFKLQKLIELDKATLYSKINIVKSKYGNPFKVEWLSPKLMWLIGIIASDGNINAGKDSRTGSLTARIRIYNTNLKILRKAKSILKSFSISTKIKETKFPNTCMIEFGNTLFAKLLLKCGVSWKKKTYSVFVPEFFYNLDEKLLWAYFSGVFDGDGKLTILEEQYLQSIRISTASKEFALGLHKLLLRVGIVSTITTRYIANKTILHGKEAYFKANNYIVIFRKKRDLIKFKENSCITKSKIPEIKYSTYHNLEKRGNTEFPFEFIKIKSIERLNKRIKVHNIQTRRTNTFFANNFLVHNCGRAGRPQFDTEGESILLAKQERVLHWLMDRYILRDSEPVYSKLAAKPALRRNILGLIASHVVKTVPDLLYFFEKTFYGFQFEAALLEGKIREVIDQFIIWEMINPLDANETLDTTRYGLRVSQLYLDPETAASLSEGLVEAVKKSQIKPHSVALLDLIVGTPDMIELSFRKKDEKKTEERLNRFKPKLIKAVPDSFDIEYEFRLHDFKTVLFLWDWINEIPIEQIIMRYNIGSGDIKRVVDTATWIMSALAEISALKTRENRNYKIFMKRAQSLSERVRYGIKKDAISLTQIKGIGRKRARMLLDHGIRDVSKLLTLDVSKLSKIPGFGTELSKSILRIAKEFENPKKEEEADFSESDMNDYFV